jgi:hypothetical protein
MVGLESAESIARLWTKLADEAIREVLQGVSDALGNPWEYGRKAAQSSRNSRSPALLGCRVTSY